mmetsp:Transcript_118760/g.188100  ORF Transcript_118760/g.188100 Transcript_118760/m.188100 type:complete len:216 (-) Transcript_118760:1472-2119(-)
MHSWFERPLLKILLQAPSSMGSPSMVPVPWASYVLISDMFSLVSSTIAFSSRCCAGPFGAVRLADRPSELTLLQATSANASSSDILPLFITMQAEPSPRPYPSAESVKEKLRPLKESMPAAQLAIQVPGARFKLIPAQTAPSRGSIGARRSLRPACSATRDAEQAVFAIKLGPFRFIMKENRFAMNVSGTPFAALTVGGKTLAQSEPLMPTWKLM